MHKCPYTQEISASVIFNIVSTTWWGGVECPNVKQMLVKHWILPLEEWQVFYKPPCRTTTASVCALRLWFPALRKLVSCFFERSMLCPFPLPLQWRLGRQVWCDRGVPERSCWWDHDQAAVSRREMVWWLLPTTSAGNQPSQPMVSGILAAQVPVPAGRVSSREP